MEILNQSTIVHKPNYFHLAYLSASTRVKKVVPNGMSAISLSTLIIGFVLSIISLRLNKYLAKKNMTKKNILFRKAHVIFLILGIMTWLIGLFYVPPRYKTIMEITRDGKYNSTSMTMQGLSEIISKHLDANETIPENMHALSSQWQIDPKRLCDDWSRMLRLEKVDTDDNTIKYFLISAGSDGLFDTEDDYKSDPIYANKEKTPETSNAALSF